MPATRPAAAEASGPVERAVPHPAFRPLPVAAPLAAAPLAADQARQAYGAPGAPTRTGRQAERQVLSSVTARLSAAAAAPGDFVRRAQALHDNRRLWTRLAADAADAGNGLPRELRARIVWLAEFTDHHSRRALRGEAGLGALIEVNTAVMRGLGGQGVEARPSVHPSAPPSAPPSTPPQAALGRPLPRPAVAP